MLIKVTLIFEDVSMDEISLEKVWEGFPYYDNLISSDFRQLSPELECIYCGQEIFDKREESGSLIADWATVDGDFGCDKNPESNNESVGNHIPK